MKKGILLTLGTFFLATLLFSFALLIYHHTQNLENRFGELALMDRMYDIDSSLQLGFRNIILHHSNLSLSLKGDSFTFAESKVTGTKLSNSLDAYKDYLEERYTSYPKIEIDDAVMDNIKTNLPLFLRNYGITYSKIYPNKDVSITTTSLNVKWYNITLDVSANAAILKSEAVQSGSFPLKVVVKYKGGQIINSWNLDPTKENSIVYLADSNNLKVRLDSGDLFIEKGSTSTLASIDMGIILSEEQPSLYLPDDLYTITFPEADLAKKGTARIL